MSSTTGARDPVVAALAEVRNVRPAAELRDRIRSEVVATSQRRRGPSPVRLVAVAAAVAAAVGALALGGGWGRPVVVAPSSSPDPGRSAEEPSGSPVPSAAGPLVLQGTWRQTALPPIDGRSEHAMAWTGSEAVVWGGIESSAEHSAFDGRLPRHGAAYNPSTDSWRVIPDAPIAGRSSPSIAWTGSEIVVFGGTSGDASQLDGAAWNPATNTWRAIARSPLTGRDGRGAWLADRLIIVTSDSAASYDPAADRWTKLPPAPVKAGFRSVAVAADRLVVVAFGDDLTSPAEWAVLDPATGTWRTGTLPIDPLKASAGFVGANELIIEPTMGRVFDPIAETWSMTPVCEGAGYGSVWTGSVVLGIRGAWDSRIQECRQVPPSPPREPPFDDSNGREFPAAIWTGTQYVTWSGGNGGDIVWVPKDGAVFTPADDLGPCCG